MNIGPAGRSEMLRIVPSSHQIDEALEMPGNKIPMKAASNMKDVKAQLTRMREGKNRMHKHGGDIYTNKGITDYSSNVNFRGIPDSVVKAAKDAVDLCTNYPDVESRELRSAIAGKDGIREDMVFCGNGAADVIFTLSAALRPKKALVPAPTFYEYEGALRAVGCEIEYFHLKEEDGFALGDDFASALRPDIDIAFICNPNNPTGCVTPKERILKILEKCEETGTVLAIDECFNEFLEDPAEFSVLDSAADHKNLFIFKAFTKMFAMPGLRLGYGVSSNGELLRKMTEVSQPWRVSIPAQAAGLAACNEKKFVEDSRTAILEEKEKLRGALEKRGFKIYGSKGNYLFFDQQPDFGEKMLAKGYLLRDCSNYEGLGEGKFRIAIRSGEDNAGFIDAVDAVIAERQK